MRNGQKIRCKATRRDGTGCHSFAVNGWTVCRMHGAGSTRRGKPGGRPPSHGLYSKAVAVSLAGRLQEIRLDPALIDGLTDIARIRALIERAEGLLSSEEAAYVLNLGKSEAVDSAMRGRLLNWYECLIKLSAEIVGAIDRYYAALEKRTGGVTIDAVQAGMIAIARVLDESIVDKALLKTINDRIGKAFERIVLAGPRGIEGRVAVRFDPCARPRSKLSGQIDVLPSDAGLCGSAFRTRNDPADRAVSLDSAS